MCFHCSPAFHSRMEISTPGGSVVIDVSTENSGHIFSRFGSPGIWRSASIARARASANFSSSIRRRTLPGERSAGPAFISQRQYEKQADGKRHRDSDNVMIVAHVRIGFLRVHLPMISEGVGGLALIGRFSR